jgi:myo-inositol-1(or 4)-monophosphatase
VTVTTTNFSDSLSPASLERAAIQMARDAALILLEYYRGRVGVQYKDTRESDPVTAADRDSEAFIARQIRSQFPGHGILGEEGSPGDPDAEYLWVIDPVDGTANFINHLQFFAVSIGVLRHGVPTAAAIYLPGDEAFGGGVYHASLGNGAFHETRAIRAAINDQPHPSGLIALPFAAERRFHFGGDQSGVPGYQRTMGSAAAELAMAAAGVFQYGLFGPLRIWDVAAGILLVTEASGAVMEWMTGGWRAFDRFDAKSPSEKDPSGYGSWSVPLLFGGMKVVQHVSQHIELNGSGA